MTNSCRRATIAPHEYRIRLRDGHLQHPIRQRCDARGGERPHRSWRSPGARRDRRDRGATRASADGALRARSRTCNLGLENWPPQWLIASDSRKAGHATDADALLPPDFLVRHDLVTVFRVGWTVLYEQVGACVARRLIGILSELSSDDSDLHAAGPRNERRQRRDLENDPGGRQKTQALAKCCH